MEVTSKYNDRYERITTITCNSEEKIILRASLKHYFGAARKYLPEKDITKIASMYDALEEGGA